MELKVWCDGIQRVVCGVSSSTTCQDIVFALAHATGQTGRFMLIEKWRNNERLLAPQEHPVSVLSKWGEYANDVTFIMKRSDGTPTTTPNKTSTASTSPNKTNGWSQKFSPLVSPKVSASPSSASASENETGTQMASQSRKSDSYLTSLNRSSIKEQKPEPSKVKSDGRIKSDQQSLPSQRPKHPPPYSEAINKSSFNSFNSSQEPLHFNEEKTTKRQGDQLSNDSPAQRQRTSPSKTQQLHKDARRLIELQIETMKNQEQDMIKIENEISLIEKKLNENGNSFKRYQEEYELHNRIWSDQESLIVKLEKEKLDDELKGLTLESRKHEEETQLIKRKLSDCEGDIALCRQKITQLMESLERSEMIAREKKEVEESEKLLMEQMRMSIREKTREIENQKSELICLTDKVVQYDAILNDKHNQVDKLISEMREANLIGLSLQPSVVNEDYHHHHHHFHAEGDNQDNNSQPPFSHRSGSTRRIVGSPRQLENAVATNKNPHGVWV